MISAVVLGPNLTEQHLSQVVINPLTRTNIGPRVDYQLSASNVLSVRYQWWEDIEDNDGIQQFSLPTQAYDLREVEHTVQVRDTQVISVRAVNLPASSFCARTLPRHPQARFLP